MQLIITDAWLAKSRAIHLSGTKLVLYTLLASFVMMLVAALLYRWVFLKSAREGWPVVGALVRLVVKDEFKQRDRFMRENLDVLAHKVGEMQAKMTQLESLGERVSGLAGVNPNEIKTKPGQGGALVSDRPLSGDDLLVMPPKATPNCSTYGHPNCPRQDGQIMGFGAGAWAGFLS